MTNSCKMWWGEGEMLAPESGSVVEGEYFLRWKNFSIFKYL